MTPTNRLAEACERAADEARIAAYERAESCARVCRRKTPCDRGPSTCDLDHAEDYHRDAATLRALATAMRNAPLRGTYADGHREYALILPPSEARDAT